VSGSWRHPGKSGALLYAVLASVVGGGVAIVSRLQVERQRGRKRVAAQLPDGAVIVIANHTSYIDGFLLALVCRRMGRTLRLLATAGVFRAPIIGGLARRVGFIPVARETPNAADALEPALAALAAGEAVGLFPEGRTTRDPQQWPERAHTGVVRLAVRSGAPVVPIAMVGAHRVIGRRRMVSKVMLNVLLRPKVSIEVGDPIDVSALITPGELNDSAALRRATDAVMSQLVALVADVRREAAPDPLGVNPNLV
jgi:1-acyl-sn-glycerol-3-phosphate acyltransferase